MKLVWAFCALSSFSSALDFAKWHPPGYGDVRSPCPALNSLANHEFIPHDGKNLTVPLLVKALGDVLNISAELATTVAAGGLRISPNPESGIYKLDDLNKHNAIEHDASLSRKDFNLGGDAHSFSLEIFNEFLGYFNSSEQITLPAAAAARWGRVQTERGRDPGFAYGSVQRFNSYVESAIYFRTLNNMVTGTTPLNFVKIFFEQERLPWNEGWRTPSIALNGLVLSQDILTLALATPETLSATVGDSFHGMMG